MFSVQEITNKWRTVRDNYTRSLKKQEKSERSGSAAGRVVKYTYDALLGFLKKCKEPRISESSFTEKSTPSNIPLISENSSLPSPSSSSSSPSHLSSPSQNTPCKKRKGNLESTFMEYLQCTIKKRKNEEEEDDNLLFFKSLLPDMKDFTNSEKYQFRMGAMQLLQDIKNKREEAVEIVYAALAE